MDAIGVLRAFVVKHRLCPPALKLRCGEGPIFLFQVFTGRAVRPGRRFSGQGFLDSTMMGR